MTKPNIRTTEAAFVIGTAVAILVPSPLLAFDYGGTLIPLLCIALISTAVVGYWIHQYGTRTETAVTRALYLQRRREAQILAREAALEAREAALKARESALADRESALRHESYVNDLRVKSLTERLQQVCADLEAKDAAYKALEADYKEVTTDYNALVLEDMTQAAGVFAHSPASASHTGDWRQRPAADRHRSTATPSLLVVRAREHREHQESI